MKCRTALAVLAVPLLVPAAAAEAREPVTSARAFAAAQQLANQSATRLEQLSNGAARIDRSRTSVGNYVSYGKFRKGASFALFGTNTVNGETHTLWCIGNVEVVQSRNGRARVAANLTCPVG
jgi:opacity protein-like surface antigen